MGKKFDHKNSGISSGQTVLISLGMAALCVILGGMLMATFFVSGSIELKHMDLAACLLLLVTTVIISAWVKARKGEGSRGVILVFAAAFVALLFVINGFLFGMEFRGLAMKLISIILGAGVMLVENKRKTGKFKKTKIR